MAEKKQHKIVSASSGKETSAKPAGVAAQQIASSTVGLRIGAVVLWVAALVCEFLALKAILAPEDAPFIPGIPPLYAGIGFLVVDLICVIIGAQLWKKANHIHPASEKNPVTFWLWNNMGVIVCAIAFIPFVVLLLTNKDADKKTKTVGTIVAVVALLIGGFASYDYNPYSQEEQQQILAMEEATSQVYWTAGGKVFHIYEDCQHLNRTEELTLGSTQEAEAAGKERLCKTCFSRHEKEQAAAQIEE
ncbi:MAG TPA: hypothetical protein DDW78_03490 [Treponema sp.]|nr:hypothetical protein [Treponema sp.]